MSPFAEEAGKAGAACSPACSLAPPGLLHAPQGSLLLRGLQKAAESLVLLHQMPPSTQPYLYKPGLPVCWAAGHGPVLFLRAKLSHCFILRVYEAPATVGPPAALLQTQIINSNVEAIY